MSARLAVKKTYKIYIGGKFPRTESGRYYPFTDKNGETVNICLGSRKDFRNAVVAARKAQGGWAGATAYLRGQILYRAAEMLEGRSAQFVEELVRQGSTAAQARREVEAATDTLVYYAGWSDKYQQVFSTVNPVASPHFNFSMPEPTGVVSILAPEDSGLFGLVTTIASVIVGGNACVALASESKPLSAVTFSEVLNDSDLPGGVVNILTGNRNELLGHMSSHMDVNGLLYCGDDKKEIKLVQENAALNIRRTAFRGDLPADGDPYHILDFLETKTTWHPVGV